MINIILPPLFNMSHESIVIKKRNRPQTRAREISVERESESESTVPIEDEKNLPSVAPLPFRHTPHFTHQVLHSIEDLIELRKLRRAREGIDVGKLNKGDLKKKKKKTEDDATTTTPTGLIKSGRQEVVDEEE